MILVLKKHFGGTIASVLASVFIVSYRTSGGRITDTSLRIVNRNKRSLEVTVRGETENKERWREICERVVVEQDPDRFTATVQELLEALEDHQDRRRNPTALRMPLREKPSSAKLSSRLSPGVCGMRLLRRLLVVLICR